MVLFLIPAASILLLSLISNINVWIPYCTTKITFKWQKVKFDAFISQFRILPSPIRRRKHWNTYKYNFWYCSTILCIVLYRCEFWSLTDRRCLWTKRWREYSDRNKNTKRNYITLHKGVSQFHVFTRYWKGLEIKEECNGWAVGYNGYYKNDKYLQNYNLEIWTEQTNIQNSIHGNVIFFLW